MTNQDPTIPPIGTQSGRSPRQGLGGSPVGSTLSIVLAVVAVIVGFLILNNITGGGSGDASGGSAAPDVTLTPTDTGLTTTTVPAATTTVLVTQGATVVVANASGVGGSAGRMTDTLSIPGFTMGDPTNATGGQVEESIVYYDPGIAAAQDVANSVAAVMGGLVVETVPSPPPVEGGSLGDAGVLVLLGTNQADKTLEEMSGTEATEDTVATGTAPDVSGDTVAPDEGGDTVTPDEGGDTVTPDEGGDTVTTDG